MGLLAFDADKLLIATIIGISTGAIYAVIASGLVVTYNTSGLFNLAHGATGVLAAFTYWQFRFGWGWPTPLALLIVLGVYPKVALDVINPAVSHTLTSIGQHEPVPAIEKATRR